MSLFESGGIADRLKRKYSLEVDEPQQSTRSPDIGDFKRFMDFAAQNPNPELWAWVSQQEPVVKARADMEQLFDLYLFETLKPQFVAFCAESSSDVIKNYVDANIMTAREYVSPTVQFEEERKQMQDLIAQQSMLIEELKVKREVVKI